MKAKDPAMFEVYKRIGWHDAFNNKSGNVDDFDDMFKSDEDLFNGLKKIITELVLVEPQKRVKLTEARKQLLELDKLIDYHSSTGYLLLKEGFLNCGAF